MTGTKRFFPNASLEQQKRLTATTEFYDTEYDADDSDDSDEDSLQKSIDSVSQALFSNARALF